MISGGGTINLNTLETLEVNNPAGILLETSITLNGILALQGKHIQSECRKPYPGINCKYNRNLWCIQYDHCTRYSIMKKEFPLSGGSFLFPLGDVTGTAEYSPVLFTLISGGISTGNYVGINLSNTVYPGGPISSSYIQRS